MTQVIDLLRTKVPNFHGSDDDPKNWKSQWGVLEYIAANVNEKSTTLETGCGYSTILFASVGADHTTVMPSPDEPKRVRAFCKENGIDSSSVNFSIGRSCDMLPLLKGELDLVYIDGAHGFPHPCVDWMYTETRLRVGGAMLVDDIRIPTCRILHDFLKEEKNWALAQYIGDTAIFTKTAESPDAAGWMNQNFNRSYPDYSFLPKWNRVRDGSVTVIKETVRSVGLEKPVKRLLGRV